MKKPKRVDLLRKPDEDISLIVYPNGRAKVFSHNTKTKQVKNLFPKERRVDIIAAEFQKLRAKHYGIPKRILKLKRHGGEINESNGSGK